MTPEIEAKTLEFRALQDQALGLYTAWKVAEKAWRIHNDEMQRINKEIHQMVNLHLYGDAEPIDRED